MLEFRADTHQYFNEQGEEYASITSLLTKMGISKSYESVDKEVLRRAAARGALIHREIQESFEGTASPETSEALEGVVMLKKRFPRIAPSMERMVWSDEWKIAGRYDALFGDCLVDIKTSSAIEDSYAWQLSIYAYLLEKEGVKVNRLFILWLPKEQYGKSELVDMTERRINDLTLEKLFEANLKGEDFLVPMEKVSLEMTDLEVLKRYAVWEARLKEMKEKSDAVKKKIYEFMLEKGIGKATSEDGALELVLKKPYETSRFDSVAFKKAHPELHAEFTKKSVSSGSVSIKIKEVGK